MMNFLSLAIAVLAAAQLQGVQAAIVRPRQDEFVLPPELAKERTENMLADIPGLPELPYIKDVVQNATLNASNIQCDILIGMLKRRETFVFFTINDPKKFKSVLHNAVISLITPVASMLSTSTQPQVALNIAFSQTGLLRLNITDNLNDGPFSNSQFPDANILGDPGTGNWKPAFTAPARLNGVFLVASDDQSLIDTEIALLQSWFGSSMTIIYKLEGGIRPPPWEGHEMFGYLDGVSQPAVGGFNLSPLPGQAIISAGIILVGEPGDTLARPTWAKDGSFLAFRQLQQLVPEWDWWVLKNAPPFGGYSAQDAADLFGARLMGRWKSGAPVDKTPFVDDPVMGADNTQNNDFDFTHPSFNFNSDQSHCPFHAHIRKTRPRADQPAPFNSIMRAGIPYGPELTAAEGNSSSTDPDLERGLAFVSYQSQISQGFRFMQQAWVNDPNFVTGKNVAPGHDPVVGAANGGPRFITGADIANPSTVMNIKEDFVVSRGGEYFFSPSIWALLNVISV